MNEKQMTTAVMLVTAFMVVFNSYQISKLNTDDIPTSSITGASVSTAPKASGPDVTPKGIPEIYGSELGISYDDVSAVNPKKADTTIKKLALLDTTITPEGDDLQRYIDITSQISCEYCCGAPSIITADGKAACGCAHSFAMRGLAKYLIKNHASEYTDDQILEELGKWKTLFFPTQLSQKAQVLLDNGIELNYINLASNKYRDIESGASGSGMVGGC